MRTRQGRDARIVHGVPLSLGGWTGEGCKVEPADGSIKPSRQAPLVSTCQAAVDALSCLVQLLRKAHGRQAGRVRVRHPLGLRCRSICRGVVRAWGGQKAVKALAIGGMAAHQTHRRRQACTPATCGSHGGKQGWEAVPLAHLHGVLCQALKRPPPLQNLPQLCGETETSSWRW